MIKVRLMIMINIWLLCDLPWLMHDYCMCQNRNPRPEWPPWAEKVSPPEDRVVKLFPRPPPGDRTPGADHRRDEDEGWVLTVTTLGGGASGAGLAARLPSWARSWTTSSSHNAAVVKRFSCCKTCTRVLLIGLPNLCSWPDNSQTHNS